MDFAALPIHLERGRLPELPGGVLKAARPRFLPGPDPSYLKADLSLPRQAFLPPGRVAFRLKGVCVRSRGLKPQVRGQHPARAEAGAGDPRAGAEGFLAALHHDARYEKVSSRKWLIRFVRNRGAIEARPGTDSNAAIQSRARRGAHKAGRDPGHCPRARLHLSRGPHSREAGVLRLAPDGRRMAARFAAPPGSSSSPSARTTMFRRASSSTPRRFGPPRRSVGRHGSSRRSVSGGRPRKRSVSG